MRLPLRACLPGSRADLAFCAKDRGTARSLGDAQSRRSNSTQGVAVVPGTTATPLGPAGARMSGRDADWCRRRPQFAGSPVPARSRAGAALHTGCADVCCSRTNSGPAAQCAAARSFDVEVPPLAGGAPLGLGIPFNSTCARSATQASPRLFVPISTKRRLFLAENSPKELHRPLRLRALMYIICMCILSVLSGPAPSAASARNDCRSMQGLGGGTAPHRTRQGGEAR